MKKSSKKTLLKQLVALCIIIVTVLSVSKATAFASSQSCAYPFYGGGSATLPNGGEFTFTTIVSERGGYADYIGVPQKIIWMTPAQVEAFYQVYCLESSSSTLKEIISVSLETVASKGMDKLSKVLATKYGAVLGAAVAKYVAVAAAGKFIYDIIGLIDECHFKKLLEDSFSSGIGLIHITNKSKRAGTASSWKKWDGSSDYGSYPTIHLPLQNNSMASVRYYGTLCFH